MRLATTTSAIVSVVIAWVTFMTFDTTPPYEYDAGSSYVIPSKTQAGHQVTVHWKLSRVNRVCPGTVTRSVVDAVTKVRITYDPALAAQSVVPGDDELNRTFLLPSGISPGKKLYYADGSYGCNLLQRWWKPLVVRTPTLEFEILP